MTTTLKPSPAQDKLDYWIINNLPIRESEIPVMLLTFNEDRKNAGLRPLLLRKLGIELEEEEHDLSSIREV